MPARYVVRKAARVNNGTVDMYEVIDRETEIFYRAWLRVKGKGTPLTRIVNARRGNVILPHGRLGTSILAAINAHHA